MEVQYCLACFEKKALPGKCTQCNVETVNARSLLHLTPGTVLNKRYIVGLALGQGGFGITYLGLDMQNNSKVAIKELYPQQLVMRIPQSSTVSASTDDKVQPYQKCVQQFMNEAAIVGKFRHSNIVEVTDSYQANGTAYMVMPYINGITLKQHIEQRGPLPMKDTAMIMLSVLDALQEVHNAKVVHRDISPDNIYITEQGLIKLLDFGAARQAFGEVSQSLSVILKQGYAPLEQYSSRGEQAAWTDIYALAASGYKVLTGVTPPGAMDRLTESRLGNKDIEWPSELGVTIDARFEEILKKSMAIEPKHRYLTAAECRRDLLAILNLQDNSRELTQFTVAVDNVEQKHQKSSQNKLEANGVAAVQLQKAMPMERKKPITKTGGLTARNVAIIVTLVVVIAAGGVAWRVLSSKSLDWIISFPSAAVAIEKLNLGDTSLENTVATIENSKVKMAALQDNAVNMSAEQLTNELKTIKAGLPAELINQSTRQQYIDSQLKQSQNGIDIAAVQQEVDKRANELRQQKPEKAGEVDSERKKISNQLSDIEKLRQTLADRLKTSINAIVQYDQNISAIINSKNYATNNSATGTVSQRNTSSYSQSSSESSYSPPPPTEQPSQSSSQASGNNNSNNNTSGTSSSKKPYQPIMRD